MEKKKYYIIAGVVLLLLPQVGFCSEEQDQTITMSLTQYNELVTTISEPDKLLMTLDRKLQELQLTQPELLNELREARILLNQTQTQLKSVDNSLGSARNIISEQNKSLEILSSEIKSQQRRAKINKIKSFLYGAGIMFVYDKVK